MMQHHSFFRNLPPFDLLHQTTPATLTASNYTYCTKVHLLHQLLDFMIEQMLVFFLDSVKPCHIFVKVIMDLL